MGNDPVNLIDPSGGIGIPCPGASPLLQSIAKAGDAVVRVLDAIAPLSSAISVGINIANAAANIFNRSVEFELTNRQLVRNGTGQVGAKREGGNAFGIDNPSNRDNDDAWHDLYKADLKRYYQQAHGRDGTENELGDEFEDIFEDYIDNGANPLFKYETRVRRYGGPTFTGGNRNTTPDFIGDVLVVGKRTTRIKGSDWFELKQKAGGLYLSSNEDQIRGHINNLKRSTTYAYEKYVKYRYKSKLWVVTTADVNFSPGISNHARSNNVLYEHIHAEYRIRRGRWQFRFEKTVSR